MTFLLGALVGLAVGIVGEGYWLMGRAQRLLSGQEQLQAAAERLLALIPSKSAPRTDGAGETPRAWLAALTGRMNATGEVGQAEPLVSVPPPVRPDVDDDRLIEHPAKRRHAAPKGK